MNAKNAATEFTTILPGAVFGPVLGAGNLGSVQVIERLLRGRPPALPRIGFWVVDVRDLADLHIRAMTSANAEGQRFLAAGDFMWMEDIAKTLRSSLDEQADRVPRRILPNFAVKLMLPFLPRFRTLAPLLGRRYPLTSDKARELLGFSPRPATATIVDCARSLLSVDAGR
ncbi:MAG TPA: hypothetical protein VI756_30905 [Blastocatellia bacterium]